MSVPNHHFGERGELVEGDYFGYFDKSKYVERLKEMISSATLGQIWTQSDKQRAREIGEPKFMEKEPAFELVRSWQFPGCVLNPEKIFAKSLRQKIETRLHQEFQNLRIDSVNYYTACSDLSTGEKFQGKPVRLGAALDWHYGTDAFFDIIINGKVIGDNATLTIDGSLKPKTEYKADMLIRFDEDKSYGPTDPKFDEFVNTQAEVAVSIIARRINELQV